MNDETQLEENDLSQFEKESEDGVKDAEDKPKKKTAKKKASKKKSYKTTEPKKDVVTDFLTYWATTNAIKGTDGKKLIIQRFARIHNTAPILEGDWRAVSPDENIETILRYMLRNKRNRT